MKTWIGKSILVIGILHSIVGLIAFRNVVLLLVHERLFNTISLNGDPHRLAAFWFLFTGFALLIVGALVDWIERRDIELPVFLMWFFIFITAAGLLMMPFSGFWLLLIPTYGFISGGRKKYKIGPYKHS